MPILSPSLDYFRAPARGRRDQWPVRQALAAIRRQLGCCRLRLSGLGGCRWKLVHEFRTSRARPDSLPRKLFHLDNRRARSCVHFSLQVDQLTIVMLLTVSFVGMLIHIYSTGYMAHEGGYYRFFCYLNLFMFFMLTLVMAANLRRHVRRLGRRRPVQKNDWFLVNEEVRPPTPAKKPSSSRALATSASLIGVLLVFWDLQLGRISADISQQARPHGFRRLLPTRRC